VVVVGVVVGVVVVNVVVSIVVTLTMPVVPTRDSIEFDWSSLVSSLSFLTALSIDDDDES
jgi:hypothetical protein